MNLTRMRRQLGRAVMPPLPVSRGFTERERLADVPKEWLEQVLLRIAVADPDLPIEVSRYDDLATSTMRVVVRKGSA